MQFWTELGVGMGFPPDDGPDPGLGQTDDAPGRAKAFEILKTGQIPQYCGQYAGNSFFDEPDMALDAGKTKIQGSKNFENTMFFRTISR